MAIRTQESFSGFIASDPQLSQTSKGDPRFYARVGKEHFRREDDGSFTQTETTYHHLVMFGRSAEHAHDRFTKGDNFIAEGYTREVNYERDGQAV
ncbi:single-stranded DNA-binding protein, partial [Burkholderia multivorans]